MADALKLTETALKLPAAPVAAGREGELPHARKFSLGENWVVQRDRSAGPHAVSLFGTGPEEIRDAVRKLSTKKGFAELGRTFFGGLLSQYLNFYICKETPNIRSVGT